MNMTLQEKTFTFSVLTARGGLAGSVEDISAALPDSNVSDNVFDVYEEDAPSAREELLDWLSGIRF